VSVGGAVMTFLQSPSHEFARGYAAPRAPRPVTPTAHEGVRSQMSGQPDVVKAQLLDDAVRQWARSERLPVDADRFGRFLQLYYRHVDLEELKERLPEQLVRHALAHWELGAQRPQGRAKVRVRSPEDPGDTGRSIVEIVTDDAPFLVSWVAMRLAERGISVRLIIHPQLRVERDTLGNLVEVDPDDYTLPPLDESWIHLEIDRQDSEI